MLNRSDPTAHIQKRVTLYSLLLHGLDQHSSRSIRPRLAVLAKFPAGFPFIEEPFDRLALRSSHFVLLAMPAPKLDLQMANVRPPQTQIDRYAQVNRRPTGDGDGPA